MSLAVACNEKDMRKVKALIIGPPESPYEFGFFEFSVNFPDKYPEEAPGVYASTTNHGKTRFNPNIYASGKVCLSILGTWRGEPGEQWSSAQGLESVLLSIQSLMSSNPYENEPGYETANSEHDKKAQRQYVEKIRHETLRIAVIARMEFYLGIYSDGVVAAAQIEPEDRQDIDEEEEESAAFAEPFKDLSKRRFLWYYESYLAAITEGEKKHKVGHKFERMPFEGATNDMVGEFNYPKLRERLQRVKRVLDEETATIWSLQAAALKKRENPFVNQIQRVFDQTKTKLDGTNVSIDTVIKDNPFVWQITYFGQPMTNLDGAFFNMRMYISPKFPDEQPRVLMETKPMFHHRIAKDGTICYFPKQAESLASHIEGIVAALEDENPAYDPRTHLNMEACKLYWGGEDTRKQYNRKLRQAVQRSSEG